MQKNTTHKFLPVALLMIAVFALYLPAISSAFYYDDYANLSALADVDNWEGFWEFVLAGNAGPLGRPVALLTFALQNAAWPEGGGALYGLNIAIHACNTLLVYCLAHSVWRLTGKEEGSAGLFSILAAALWASSPILASSSLILIQRMTTLSGLFTLLTILIYVGAFSAFKGNNLQRLVWQGGVVGAGTILAMLSKENGALLPALIFSLEITLLRTTSSADAYRKLRVVVSGISLTVLLIYISPIVRPWFEIHDFRGYSSWQRLQGEAIIVWKYLYLTFFPKISHFGPFQDQWELLSGAPSALLSLTAWVTLVVAAALLRKKFPWFAFAVMWFVIGHLLESTTILLEPYYEHRNYIPLVGVWMWFAQCVVNLSRTYRMIKYAAFGYLAVNAVILFTVASLWGRPVEAAEFWVETNPGSVRAVVHQVNLGTSGNASNVLANNEAVFQVNQLVGAMQLLDKTATWCGDCLGVQFQALAYACVVEEPDEKRIRLTRLEATLLGKNNRVDVTSVDSTAILAQLIAIDKCKGVQYADIDRLLDGLLNQGRYKTSSELLSKIYFQKATLMYAAGRLTEAEQWIDQADKYWPTAEPVIDYKVELLLEKNEPLRARDFLENKMDQNRKGEIKLSVKYAQHLDATLKNISHEHQRRSTGQK